MEERVAGSDLPSDSLNSAIIAAMHEALEMLCVAKTFDPFLLTWRRQQRFEDVLVGSSREDSLVLARERAAKAPADAAYAVLAWAEKARLTAGATPVIMLEAHERGTPSTFAAMQPYRFKKKVPGRVGGAIFFARKPPLLPPGPRPQPEEELPSFFAELPSKRNT
jgi:hypothetical protein